MGSDARRTAVEERIEFLRELERRAASESEPSIRLLAAIRKLLMEAEADLEA